MRAAEDGAGRLEAGAGCLESGADRPEQEGSGRFIMNTGGIESDVPDRPEQEGSGRVVMDTGGIESDAPNRSEPGGTARFIVDTGGTGGGVPDCLEPGGTARFIADTGNTGGGVPDRSEPEGSGRFIMNMGGIESDAPDRIEAGAGGTGGGAPDNIEPEFSRPWERNIRRVTPYIPGEQPRGSGLIKLNTNENPYPPSPAVQEALAGLSAGELRRYPDPAASGLVRALAEYYGVAPGQVFTGVGSDDVLGMAFLTFFNSGRPVLFPDLTYSFYPVWARLFGIPYETCPLREDFTIDPRDYDRENGGVIFPNPNAPTGCFLPLAQVEEILRHNRDVVVIVDEAYIDFGGTSARALLGRYENLLVVQTFSKSRSMAGMRIGFALGAPELIRAMQNVKYSYNSYTMNLPSILAGEAALKDEAYYRETLGKITATRERAKERLAGLGFTFPDSQANFLFIRHERVPAKELYEALRARQIYVRYFPGPRSGDFLRVTVGTDAEMEAFYAFLETYLGETAGSF